MIELQNGNVFVNACCFPMIIETRYMLPGKVNRVRQNASVACKRTTVN
jgi:hypothetical protein